MRPFFLAGSTALALTLALPSHALTPEALWAQWSASLKAQGMEVPTDAAPDADGVLAITDLTTATGTDGTLRIPELRLVPQGEAVQVQMPRPLEASDADGSTTTIDLSGIDAVVGDAEQPGILGAFTLTATGAASIKGHLQKEAADDTVATDTDDTAEGADALPVDITFEGQARGIEVEIGTTNDAGDSQATLSMAGGTLRAEGRNVQGAPFSMTVENGPALTTLAIEGMEQGWWADPIAAISAGSNIQLTFAQESGSYAVKNGAEDTWTRWTRADVQMGIDRTGFHYGAEVGDLESGGTLPDSGSFGMTAARMAFTMAMPLFASERAQTGAFSMLFADARLIASIPDAPAEVAELLKDPIQAEIAATADIELDQDLWPTAMDAKPTDAGQHMRITNIHLDKGLVEAGGAKATATGTMELVGPNVSQSLPGAGEAEVVLHGAEGLLDRIAALGLIDAAQRAQTSMVLRGLAKPGDTDPLTYDIVQNASGELTINGNPM